VGYKKIAVFDQYVAVSWKQYVMHSIADRKSYMIYWTASLSHLSVTLSWWFSCADANMAQMINKH